MPILYTFRLLYSTIQKSSSNYIIASNWIETLRFCVISNEIKSSNKFQQLSWWLKYAEMNLGFLLILKIHLNSWYGCMSENWNKADVRQCFHSSTLICTHWDFINDSHVLITCHYHHISCESVFISTNSTIAPCFFSNASITPSFSSIFTNMHQFFLRALCPLSFFNSFFSAVCIILWLHFFSKS